MTETTAVSKEWIRKKMINVKMYADPWYKPAPIHERIAEFLQNENIRRGILIVPTQFGKTTLAMQTFPAWCLAKYPNKNILSVSYNEIFANKQSVICRDFFLSPGFRELFPWLKLHTEMTTKHEWRLSGKYRGGIIFTGKGGGITGNPADVFIIDDLYKNYEEALSQLQQEKDFEWFDHTCRRRLQDEYSRILIIGSRMVKNDLVGRIQAREEELNTPVEDRFVVLNLPAIINCKKQGDLATGESSWPEKKSMKFLMDDYTNNPSVFISMMQGNPIDTATQLIRSDWWEKVTQSELKEYGKIDYSVRGWDFGYSEKGNWTAGARIDVYSGNRPVLADVVRWQSNTATTVQKIKQITLKDGPRVVVGLESGGTQIAMTDRIKQERELYNYSIVTKIPRKAKVERAMPWILKVQDKKFLMEPGEWSQKFLAECDGFSENCREDDQIDSVSTAWEILYGGRGQGIQ